MPNNDIAELMGGEFDPNSVEQRDFDPIPAGWYKFLIENPEVKETKSGGGVLLKIDCTVIDGEYQGRKIFKRFNIINANQTAQEIAHRELAALALALGLTSVKDSSQLADKIVMGKAKVTKGQNGDPDNDIAQWKAADGASTEAPPETTTKPRTPASTASTTAAREAAKPAATAGKVKRPWEH